MGAPDLGTEPKIILFDIETAPRLAWVWGQYEQNVIDVKTEWYMLSFAWKELGTQKVTVHALPDYGAWQTTRENDSDLAVALWKVLDDADVVIAHNGDRFDIRKANARFIAHGMKPPSPYKSIDTLKVARRHFKFDSNKLNDLGKYLGVGRKLPHTGAHLWFGCMNGDPKAWALMRRYNRNDVELLERVYLKLRPWATTHPSLTHYTSKTACPTCQSPKIINSGYLYLKTGKRQRIKCTDCGAWSTRGGLIHV